MCLLNTVSAKKYSLIYNLEKGSKYYLNVSSNQNIHQEVNGMDIDIKITYGGKTSYEVSDIQDNIMELKVIYETLSFTMESPMMNLNYNSEVDSVSDNPMHNALRAVVGVPFDVKIDNKGKVLSVTGFDNVYSGMVDNFGGNSEMVSQMAESIKKQFGNEAMKNSIAVMTDIFPDSKVEVGDSWEKSVVQNAGMSITTNSNITLTEADNNQWTLQGKSELVSNPDSTMEMNGMTQMFDMKGTSEFTMILDAKSGWIKEGDVVQELEGVVSVEGGQLPAPMEIPMKIKTETNTSSL